MKTCPICPKRKTQAEPLQIDEKDTHSTKITSILKSPLQKSYKKTTL